VGDDRGAGLAEFALVAPLLLLILFGIVEFGIAFNRAQAMEAAAREGARLASISSSTQAEIEARIDATLVGIPMQNAVITTINPNQNQPCQGNQGDPVTVTVTTDHEINIPLFGTPTVTLNGQAVFRCEA
jgi:Flp pilus assembly protein TadG